MYVQCVGICSYCDCWKLPVISRLSREHAAILKAATAVRAALDPNVQAISPQAGELLDELLDLLVAHGSYEERSLYRELRGDDTFAETAFELCAEHSTIYGALRRVRRRGTQGKALLPALDQLCDHIMKEEEGLFPPAVMLLSASAWERAAEQS